MKVKLEEGQDNHIKGFILNKLYLGGYFCKRGRKHHGKHTSVKNLPKGYPSAHRGNFRKIIKEMRRSGLIMVFPSGSDKHVCVSRNPDKINDGIRLCNEYRESVDLPPLDKEFHEILQT